eukprot:gene1437-2767_t
MTEAYHFEKDQIDESTFDDYMSRVSDIAPTNFRIAIVTAGAFRSFAFVEKSWRRYVTSPWKENIFIFAHVVASKNCIFSHKGLEALRNISTEIEVGYSNTPLIPPRIVQKKLPDSLKKSDYFRGHAKGMNRGNFFDMHMRRIRAYEMARGYAERQEFTWDLVVLLRLDTAFYSPKVEFARIYRGLQSYMNTTNRSAIYIPSICNFYGVCDRMAIGLPKEMEVYFQPEWPFEVLKWAVSPSIGLDQEIVQTKQMMATDGNSEHILKCWFIMNNLTEVYSRPGQRILGFVTLRTATADAYCNMTRHDYLYKYPKINEFIWEPDKVPGYPDQGSVYSGFDLVADAAERCGPIYKLNATALCMTRECNCGKYG